MIISFQYYFLTLFVALILIPLSSEVGVDDTIEYCYPKAYCWHNVRGRHYDQWPPLCFEGSRQSPIDLPLTHKKSHDAPVKINLDMKTYNKERLYHIWNNGHTIQVQPVANLADKSKARISADKKKKNLRGRSKNPTYIFVQAHVHWGRNNSEGSEHTIEGKKFSLEMHLVHYSSNFESFQQAGASSDPTALAVIGILFEAEDKTPSNPLFEKINENFPFKYEEAPSKNLTLNIYDFLPKEGSSFYRYEGSLTTPGCMEIVQWNVFSQPVQISTEDLENFHKSTDARSHTYDFNCRPIQHGNLRNIYFLDVTYK